MSKLTPWFDGKVVPARAGVYERRVHRRDSPYAHLKYAHWNGKFWTPVRATPNDALVIKVASGIVYAQWRGLASKAQEQGA